MTLPLFLLALTLPNEIKLVWNASASPDVTYILYAHTNAITPTKRTFILNVGTNLTTSIFLPPGNWQFAASAMDTNGVESKLSNVVCYSIGPTKLEQRQPPRWTERERKKTI